MLHYYLCPQTFAAEPDDEGEDESRDVQNKRTLSNTSLYRWQEYETLVIIDEGYTNISIILLCTQDTLTHMAYLRTLSMWSVFMK